MYGKQKAQKSAYSYSFDDINEALFVLKEALLEEGERVETRNGVAYEFRTPVSVTFNSPTKEFYFTRKEMQTLCFIFLKAFGC